ncbi:MAG TPA: 2OG-Fe(II) oxygenase [Polyangia bacterium]|nr:2OG-Fe(II) oxygenase [Polyangia bacterium]
MRSVLAAELLDGVDGLARSFRAAEPFKHVVVEPLLAPELARGLAAEFRAPASGELRALGPAFQSLDDTLRSPEFLQLLTRLTGIPRLVYDPNYDGGGALEHRAAEAPRVELPYHSNRKWYRCLNLIVFLDPEWQAEWGGAVALHAEPERPERDRVARVAPAFNRALLFEVGERSWRGVEALAPPPGRDAASRVLSIYFYAQESASRRRAPEHAAPYVERPLPLTFTAGGRSNGEELATIKGLIARRRQQLQRIVRREERILDEAQHRVEELLDSSRTRYPAAAVDATRWLVARLDEHLQFVYERELVLTAALLGDEPAFTSGVSVVRALRDLDGLYDDWWAGSQLRFRFSVAMPVTEVRLRGRIPAQLEEQELRLTLDHLLVDKRFPPGDFEWVIPFSAPIRAEVVGQVVASRSWSPKRAGVSDDVRELAWWLEDLIVE